MLFEDKMLDFLSLKLNQTFFPVVALLKFFYKFIALQVKVITRLRINLLQILQRVHHQTWQYSQ